MFFVYAQFILYVTFIISVIFTIGTICDAILSEGYTKYIGVTIFLFFSILIFSYSLLSIAPDFIMCITNCGPSVAIHEEGVIDYRNSTEFIPWEYVFSVKKIGSPLMGISTVRLELSKNSNIKFRAFRIDRIFQKYVLPIRNRYLYINIKSFNEDANIIGSIIEYAFMKHNKLK